MFGKISESRAKYENFLKGENFLRNSHEMFRCFPIIYNEKGEPLGTVKKLVQCSHIYFIADNKLWIFINIPALSRSQNQTSLIEEDKHSKKRFSRLLSQIGGSQHKWGEGVQTFQCDFAGTYTTNRIRVFLWSLNEKKKEECHGGNNRGGDCSLPTYFVAESFSDLLRCRGKHLVMTEVIQFGVFANFVTLKIFCYKSFFFTKNNYSCSIKLFEFCWKKSFQEKLKFYTFDKSVNLPALHLNYNPLSRYAV